MDKIKYNLYKLLFFTEFTIDHSEISKAKTTDY